MSGDERSRSAEFFKRSTSDRLSPLITPYGGESFFYERVISGY